MCMTRIVNLRHRFRIVDGTEMFHRPVAAATTQLRDCTTTEKGPGFDNPAFCAHQTR